MKVLIPLLILAPTAAFAHGGHVGTHPHGLEIVALALAIGGLATWALRR